MRRLVPLLLLLSSLFRPVSLHAQCPPTGPCPIQRQSEGPTVADASVLLITSHAAGSGTCIDYDPDKQEAVVLTCKHLFEDYQGGGIVVHFPDGVRCTGTLLARDAQADLAVVTLRVRGKVVCARVADALPRPSAVIWQVGYPLGKGPHVNRGVLVGRHEDGSSLTLSFPVISGDSGSGVFGEDGRLVGVVWGYYHQANGQATSLPQVQRFLATCWPRGAAPLGPTPQGPRPTTPPVDLAPLQAQLRSLQEQIQKLQAVSITPPAGPAGPAGPPGKDADLKPLQADVAALRNEVQSLREALNQLSGTIRVRVQPK